MTDLTKIGLSPALATNRDPAKARIKVSTATRQELQSARGQIFVGKADRAGVPVGNSFYSVLKAPAGKYLIIEDAIITVDFSAVTNGEFRLEYAGWVDESNGNTWSYTVSNPVPVGRSLSGEFINVLPTSTFDEGVTVTGLTGLYDYPFYIKSYFIESQGSRQNISESGENFFNKGRIVVLKPEQELLVSAVTTGDSAETIDVGVTFFASEVDADTFPED